MRMRKRDRFSPLYSRYNGAMLAIFMWMCQMSFDVSNFAKRRGRISQFLDEIGAKIAIPKSRKVYCNRFYDDVFNPLLSFLTEKAPATKDLFCSFFLSRGFVSYAMNRRVSYQEKKVLLSCLKEFDIDPNIMKELAAKMPPLGSEKQVKVDDLMSPTLEFVKELIKPIKIEQQTCFVSMPFTKPFEDYYSLLYRPLLERNGFRCFRAWGGISSEVYLSLMLDLIDKSGCMLAELTNWNANVMFELGYAYGRRKLVFQLANEQSYMNPSNLKNTGTIPYNPLEQDWPVGFIRGLGSKVIRDFRNSYRKRQRGSGSGSIWMPLSVDRDLS